MQSFQGFEQAIYSEILQQQSAAGHDPVGGAELAGQGTGARPHQNDVPQPKAISDAMTSVWIQGSVVQFGPLEDATDR